MRWRELAFVGVRLRALAYCATMRCESDYVFTIRPLSDYKIGAIDRNGQFILLISQRGTWLRTQTACFDTTFSRVNRWGRFHVEVDVVLSIGCTNRRCYKQVQILNKQTNKQTNRQLKRETSGRAFITHYAITTYVTILRNIYYAVLRLYYRLITESIVIAY